MNYLAPISSPGPAPGSAPYRRRRASPGSAPTVSASCAVKRSLNGCDASAAASRDWAEALGEETLIAAADRHLVRNAAGGMLPGDVLIFRFRPSSPAKHAGILATEGTFVHAMEGGLACEVPLSRWWRRRIAAVFTFPGVLP
jgi:NlpC/P60 family putative phage cell wall peptidase